MKTYTSKCFMVQIDDGYFFAGADRDWTDHPAYGRKYGRLKFADAVASEERAKHTGRTIRPVRVEQTYEVHEA